MSAVQGIARGFRMPATCRLGWGTLDGVGADARHLGASKALVVTSAALARSPLVPRVADLLRASGVETVAFDHATHIPDSAQAEDGARLYREAGCDSLVSVGGGNPHDLAKAIGALVESGGSLPELEGVDRLRAPNPPHVAVNTTAGTGSELSRYAFILRRGTTRRLILSDARLTPSVAINDPATHRTMPPALTASSGMNLVTHAVEAYLSVDSMPIVDAMALDAIALAGKYLERAVRDGNDDEARTGMAEAEQLAGIAYNSAGLGVADAISLTLSAEYGIPHGECNAIVLPYVLAYDLRTSAARLGEISRALLGRTDAVTPGLAEEAPTLVEGLARRVGLHHALADYNVNWDSVYTFVYGMLENPFVAENPRPLTKDALGEIFLDAVQGEDPRRAVASLAGEAR